MKEALPRPRPGQAARWKHSTGPSISLPCPQGASSSPGGRCHDTPKDSHQARERTAGPRPCFLMPDRGRDKDEEDGLPLRTQPPAPGGLNVQWLGARSGAEGLLLNPSSAAYQLCTLRKAT